MLFDSNTMFYIAKANYQDVNNLKFMIIRLQMCQTFDL